MVDEAGSVIVRVQFEVPFATTNVSDKALAPCVHVAANANIPAARRPRQVLFIRQPFPFPLAQYQQASCRTPRSLMDAFRKRANSLIIQ